MEAAPLRLDCRGRWFDAGVELVHHAVGALLDASIAPAEGGGYEVVVEGVRRAVEVEDMPLFVASLRGGGGGTCTLLVRNRGEEPLEPETLLVDGRGFTARLACGMRARFLRPAYVELALRVEEEEGAFFLPLPGGGRLRLTCCE